MRSIVILTIAATIGAAGCAATSDANSGSDRERQVADAAAEIRPLGEGETLPNVGLRRPDGTAVSTAQALAVQPTVLVIYRGGWCPYCTRQMQDLARIEPELRELGYQIVAVSPDRPEELAKSIAKENLNYTLLSDSDIELAKAMGLAFRVDDAVYARLKEMGIDLEQASDRDHHVLPVPAVYLLDTNGAIHFAYWDPDYKTRLSGDDLLGAAQRLSDKLN